MLQVTKTRWHEFSVGVLVNDGIVCLGSPSHFSQPWEIQGYEFPGFAMKFLCIWYLDIWNHVWVYDVVILCQTELDKYETSDHHSEFPFTLTFVLSVSRLLASILWWSLSMEQFLKLNWHSNPNYLEKTSASATLCTAYPTWPDLG
jgi:hypothetical protein